MALKSPQDLGYKLTTPPNKLQETWLTNGIE